MPAVPCLAARLSLPRTVWLMVPAAIDEAVPTPVRSTALDERFSSRGEADSAHEILSAGRHEFGGHLEKNG